MILIKLGGSIITNKEKPLSARRKTIDNLSKSLKKIKEPIIITWRWIIRTLLVCKI